MPKGDLIEIEGQIADALGGGKYRVKTAKADIIAQLSGRLMRNHIRVLPGDRVRVK
jgi:translation initiation factor IF-1